MKVSLQRLFLTLCGIAGVIGAQAQEVTSLQIAVSTKPTVAVTEGKLAVGGTRTLVTIVEPASAASLPVTWSIDDESIAAFVAGTPGKIRGMGAGVAVVTAEVGGVTADYTVTVSQKDAKVGDFYFSNNSWEASGIVDGKECIGMIFYVNPDNKQSGKIVSLDEATQLKWSLAETAQPGAVSDIDGAANLKAIKGVSGWESNFEAEAWCAAKDGGNLNWYLPAIDELRQLFAASCGLTWVESGADEANKEINNWTGISVTMLPGDETNPYPEERAAFNKKLTNIGATALNADGTTRYWSSTEYGDDFAQLLSFEGGYAMSQPRQYFHVGNTRAIATFPSVKEDLSAIDSIAADVANAEEVGEVEFFNLQGVKVTAENMTSGIYVMRQGTTTAKVFVK